MSCLTGKQIAIQEHHLCYNFFPSFEEFSVLATKSQVMERLLIGHCIMSVVSSQTLTPLEFLRWLTLVIIMWWRDASCDNRFI